MDDADIAQMHEEQLRTAFARVKALPPSLSLENCEDCGTPIPERRRWLVPGVRLCIYCKQKQEDRR